MNRRRITGNERLQFFDTLDCAEPTRFLWKPRVSYPHFTISHTRIHLLCAPLSSKEKTHSRFVRERSRFLGADILFHSTSSGSSKTAICMLVVWNAFRYPLPLQIMI